MRQTTPIPDLGSICNFRATQSRFPPILWTLGIGFVLRAGLALAAAFTTSGPIVYYSPDSESYLSVAREMAVTGRFTRGGTPELARTPGYPLLLELGVRLGHVEAVTITLQLLLSCATVWIVYQISMLVFVSEGSARLCALLYAIEPLSIVYTCKLLSETLFAFVLALALWGLVGHLQTGARLALVGSAVASATSIYIRPVAYFVPAIVGVVLCVNALLARRSREHTIRESGGPSQPVRWVDAAVFVGISMALVGAWQMRNIVETGYGAFAAIGDETLYFYQGASVISVEEGKSYYRVQKELGYYDRSLFESMHIEQTNWTRAEKYRWLRYEGGRLVLAHPMIYAWIHAKGVARLMLDPGGFEYLRLLQAYPMSGGLLGKVVDRGLWSLVATLLRERPGAIALNAALGLMLLGYLALATAGMVSKAFWRNPALSAMWVIGVYFVVMFGGPQAEGRFRHPLMPIVSVMAGAGWMTLMERSKKRDASAALKAAVESGATGGTD
jgi:Dolichyl-phosphate-mannose-protein mannosyltransferase